MDAVTKLLHSLYSSTVDNLAQRKTPSTEQVTQIFSEQQMTAQFSKTLNQNLRFEIAEALRTCGKFSSVAVKLDNRRKALYLRLRRASRAVMMTADVIESVLRKAGYTTVVTDTGNSFNTMESTYRVHTLVETIPKAAEPAPKAAEPAPKATTLVDALREQLNSAKKSNLPQVKVGTQVIGVVTEEQAQQLVSYINDNLVRVEIGNGYAMVSKSMAETLALKTKSFMNENAPKDVSMTLVDSAKGAYISLTVPHKVAGAIRSRTPSYSSDGWTVKSTSGITWATSPDNKVYLYT